jgi:hypothetical protein
VFQGDRGHNILYSEFGVRSRRPMEPHTPKHGRAVYFIGRGEASWRRDVLLRSVTA